MVPSLNPTSACNTNLAAKLAMHSGKVETSSRMTRFRGIRSFARSMNASQKLSKQCVLASKRQPCPNCSVLTSPQMTQQRCLPTGHEHNLATWVKILLSSLMDASWKRPQSLWLAATSPGNSWPQVAGSCLFGRPIRPRKHLPATWGHGAVTSPPETVGMHSIIGASSIHVGTMSFGKMEGHALPTN